MFGHHSPENGCRCDAGHLAVVEFLLDAKAPVDGRDDHGRTALMGLRRKLRTTIWLGCCLGATQFLNMIRFTVYNSL